MIELMRRDPSPFKSFWQNDGTIKPGDLYCYLRARFGPPNGLMMALIEDSSDNLFHWHYCVRVKGEWLEMLSFFAAGLGEGEFQRSEVDVWDSGLSLVRVSVPARYPDLFHICFSFALFRDLLRVAACRFATRCRIKSPIRAPKPPVSSR